MHARAHTHLGVSGVTLRLPLRPCHLLIPQPSAAAAAAATTTTTATAAATAGATAGGTSIIAVGRALLPGAGLRRRRRRDAAGDGPLVGGDLLEAAAARINMSIYINSLA
jgi:hypothetical protein